MSVRSRFKYQQAPKQGFKPQIPDGSDEADEAEFSTGVFGGETEIEQTPKRNFLAVSKNKGGVIAFLRSRLAFVLHLIWRITASVFTKIRNFQQSYLKSITAEGPKEEGIPLFSQKNESGQEEKLSDEDTLLAQQIEATSRQLTDLHRNLASEPSEEGELPGEDDFDEAVRKARIKLIMAAALVFFCIGSFFAYQFVSARWAKEDSVASENQNNEIINPKFEEDDGFPPPQSVKQMARQNSPNTIIPEISEVFEVPSLNDSEEETDFASMSVPSPGSFDVQDDPFEVTFGGIASDSPQISEEEFDDIIDDTENVFANPIPPTLSLGPSLQASETPSQQPLQGEMEGLTITIHDSPVANLPLPQTSALAQRATLAPQFAARFQDNQKNTAALWEPEELDEEEPFAPTLATPNQRYQDNVSPTINETAIQVPSSEPRRQRALSFGDSPVQLQAPVEARTSSKQNEHRQYTVQDGDNFYNIARRELGDVTRWREISRLNRESLGTNVGYLTPGTVISLPE